MRGFIGYVQLDSSIKVPALVKNGSGVPSNGDALPTYRCYGPAGLMTNGTGSAAFKDTGSITNATNASPIVVTSVGHGLTVGTRLTISGVGGNTAANGTFVVSAVTADTFTLSGSTGNGAYTSGGTWNVTGLYHATINTTAANGFEPGQTYIVLTTVLVDGGAWSEVTAFTVT